MSGNPDRTSRIGTQSKGIEAGGDRGALATAGTARHVCGIPWVGSRTKHRVVAIDVAAKLRYVALADYDSAGGAQMGHRGRIALWNVVGQLTGAGGGAQALG